MERGYRVRNGYIFLLLILYQIAFLMFDTKINTKGYIMFLTLIFLYYLFDVFNFKDRHFGKKDLIYSLGINFLIFELNFSMKIDREIAILIFAFSTIQILAKKIILNNTLNKERTLVIDNGKNLNKVVDVLNKNIKYLYMGYVSDEKFENNNYLGKISDILHIIRAKKINRIIFTNKKQIKNHLDLMLRAKLSESKVTDYLNFMELVEGKLDAEEMNPTWVLFSSGFESFNSKFQEKLKRVFDVVASSILLIISFPFIILTYLLVKTDGGPAFFKQKRIGYLGKEFEIIKFRSMKIHDPNKFSKYASEKDDRITKIGRFIRKTRLDELPQLINVFRGDMSFVGPRPEWNELGHVYEEKIKNYKLRYIVRPGITGWAQTMYFYSSNLEEVKRKLEYDLFYVKHQNFILDIIILFKTVRIVLFGKGI